MQLPKHVIVYDFETYYSSTFSLSKMTTAAYLRSPEFEAIMVSYSVDGGPICNVVGADIAPALAALPWGDALAVAHNGTFDHTILSWRYGIQPQRLACTMAMAAPVHGLVAGGSLAALAKYYNLPDKGTAVVNALGKHLADFTPEELREYSDYCNHDTWLCQQLYLLLAPCTTLTELSVIDATLRMYTRPLILLDQLLVEASRQEEHDEKVATKRDFLAGAMSMGLTIGFFTDETLVMALQSNDKFADILRVLGVEPPTQRNNADTGDIYAFAKSDQAFDDLLHHDDPLVRMAVEARMAVKSTIGESRAERFAVLATQGPMPFPLKYYGAEQTGRWSAMDSINVQNLKRTSMLREAMRAPEGMVFVVGDLSQVELRVGLWLAGQTDKLNAFAEGHDLYKQTITDTFNTPYTEVTKDQRQVGKVIQLSAIYGTSAMTIRKTVWVMTKQVMEEAAAAKAHGVYRANHPYVVNAWKEGDRALRMLYNKQTGSIWDGKCYVTHEGIRKPNGAVVRYPELRQVVDEKTQRLQWVYTRYKRKARIPTKIYAAKVFQNLVQSLARDIIAEALARINDLEGYRATLNIVGIVHDELILLVPYGYQDKAISLMRAAMTTRAKWFKDIPLACDVSAGHSYGEAK